MKNYKTVLEVQAIIDSKKTKNKKLLELKNWRYDRSRNTGMACNIANDLISKWILENFGEENRDKVERAIKQKYPLQFEKFVQVEKDDCLTECIYVGFWRENKERLNNRYGGYNMDLEEVLRLIPNVYDLKKESQIEACFGVLPINVKKQIEKLELKYKRQVAEYEKFKNETGLPLRFLGGEFRDSLSQFQEKKSNLEYLKFQDSYIAIEKIEHWDKSYSEYNHGVGRLESTDRAILLSRNGKLTRYPLKSFSGDFLLKFIKENFKIKKFKYSKELAPVQLDECFELSPALHNVKDGSSVYVRFLNGRKWDYCYIKDGITYHAATIDLAIEGHAEKVKKMERKKIPKDQLWTSKKAHEQFGFCLGGIRSFCNLNGLDPKKEYTSGELKEVIKRKLRENLERYGREIKKVFQEFA